MKIPNRDRTLHFRATLAEKQQIQRRANKMRIRTSVYVRQCVMKDLALRDLQDEEYRYAKEQEKTK